MTDSGDKTKARPRQDQTKRRQDKERTKTTKANGAGPRQDTTKTRPRKKSYPKIDPAKGSKQEQIRTGPGGAKFPDSAAVKIWSLFN